MAVAAAEARRIVLKLGVVSRYILIGACRAHYYNLSPGSITRVGTIAVGLVLRWLCDLRLSRDQTLFGALVAAAARKDFDLGRTSLSFNL